MDENSASSFLIHHVDGADPTKYHIHDVLILKYFPDTYFTQLPRGLRLKAILYEDIGKAPPRVPWPLPPPRPREELEVGVEEWRNAAIQTVDRQLALYAARSTKRHVLSSKPSVEPVSYGNASHRVLGINELLENILREAAPSTQYTAWNVSTVWRDTVTIILRKHYRTPHPCPPVEYGQIIEQGLAWLQPSTHEFDELQDKLESVSREMAVSSSRRWPNLCIPARLTQADELPPSTFEQYHTLISKALPLSYRSDEKRWLDFSQFQFNPCFRDLFGNDLHLTLGRCEIDIQPWLQRHLSRPVWGMRPSMKELVESMFLTQPPCKALGIYRVSYQLKPVARVFRADGIRIGDFLTEIQQHVTSTID